MQTAYKYTEYISHSGNTKIYVFKRKEERTRKQRKQLLHQKILGFTLITAGITGCVLFPEDCGGFLVTGLLGLTRIICN